MQIYKTFDIIVSFEILNGGTLLIGNEADFFATREFLSTLGLTDELRLFNKGSNATPGNVFISRTSNTSQSELKWIMESTYAKIVEFWTHRNISGSLFVHVSTPDAACTAVGNVVP